MLVDLQMRIRVKIPDFIKSKGPKLLPWIVFVLVSVGSVVTITIVIGK